MKPQTAVPVRTMESSRMCRICKEARPVLSGFNNDQWTCNECVTMAGGILEIQSLEPKPQRFPYKLHRGEVVRGPSGRLGTVLKTMEKDISPPRIYPPHVLPAPPPQPRVRFSKPPPDPFFETALTTPIPEQSVREAPPGMISTVSHEVSYVTAQPPPNAQLPSSPAVREDGTRVLKEAHLSAPYPHMLGDVVYTTQSTSPEGLTRITSHMSWDPADFASVTTPQVEVVTVRESPNWPRPTRHLAPGNDTHHMVVNSGPVPTQDIINTPLSSAIVERVAAPGVKSRERPIVVPTVAAQGRTARSAADFLGPVKTIEQYAAEIKARVAASNAAGHTVEVVALAQS